MAGGSEAGAGTVEPAQGTILEVSQGIDAGCAHVEIEREPSGCAGCDHGIIIQVQRNQHRRAGIRAGVDRAVGHDHGVTDAGDGGDDGRQAGTAGAGRYVMGLQHPAHPEQADIPGLGHTRVKPVETVSGLDRGLDGLRPQGSKLIRGRARPHVYRNGVDRRQLTGAGRCGRGWGAGCQQQRRNEQENKFLHGILLILVA